MVDDLSPDEVAAVLERHGLRPPPEELAAVLASFVARSSGIATLWEVDAARYEVVALRFQAVACFRDWSLPDER